MVDAIDVHGAKVEGRPGFVYLRVVNSGVILFAGTIRNGASEHAVTSTMLGLEPMVRLSIEKELERLSDDPPPHMLDDDDLHGEEYYRGRAIAGAAEDLIRAVIRAREDPDAVAHEKVVGMRRVLASEIESALEAAE